MKILNLINQTLLNLNFRIIIIASLFVQSFFVIFTYGSTDIHIWNEFRESIGEIGVINTYARFDFFNHPPIIAYFLKFSSNFSFISTSILIRALAVISSLGFSILAHKILIKFSSKADTFTSLKIFFLSPMIISVVAFHGNTDAIFIYLLLLSFYYLFDNKNIYFSSIAFSLALGIKIVPLYFLPVIFFSLREIKDKLNFFSILIFTQLLFYSYYIYHEKFIVIKNIFFYKSLPGYWGLSYLGKIANLSLDHISYILLALIVLLNIYLSYKFRKLKNLQDKFKLISLLTLSFFILTPGFGPQYLFWLVFLIFTKNAYFLLINLTGSIFCITTYSIWSSSLIWNFADAGKHKDIISIFSLVFVLILLKVALNIYSDLSKFKDTK